MVVVIGEYSSVGSGDAGEPFDQIGSLVGGLWSMIMKSLSV